MVVIVTACSVARFRYEPKRWSMRHFCHWVLGTGRKQATMEQSSDQDQAAPEKRVTDKAPGQGIGEVVNHRIEDKRMIEGNRQRIIHLKNE